MQGIIDVELKVLQVIYDSLCRYECDSIAVTKGRKGFNRKDCFIELYKHDKNTHRAFDLKLLYELNSGEAKEIQEKLSSVSYKEEEIEDGKKLYYVTKEKIKDMVIQRVKELIKGLVNKIDNKEDKQLIKSVLKQISKMNKDQVNKLLKSVIQATLDKETWTVEGSMVWMYIRVLLLAKDEDILKKVIRGLI